MVDIIGFISGVAGIYSFIEALVPAKPEGPSASVRIAVGLSGSEGPDGGPDGPLTGPDGVVKSVRIYNNNDEFLSAGPDNVGIGDGGFTDITLNQGNNQQALGVQVRVGDGENICLAYISVQSADGMKRAWDGTWAPGFGLDWYYSGILVSEGSKEQGLCIWLDNLVGTIHVYLPTFAAPEEGEPVVEDINHYIGVKGFRAYVYNDAQGEIALPVPAAQRKKRAVKKADPRIVVSDRPGHSAVTLCESDTSYGPSFVSLAEGMFCNMETREILPICVEGMTEKCFSNDDTESSQRVGAASVKGFKNVIDWTGK